MIGVDVTAYYLLENSVKTVGNSLDHISLQYTYSNFKAFLVILVSLA